MYHSYLLFLYLSFVSQNSPYLVVLGLWGAPCGRFWSLGRSKLLLVFGAQQAAFGLGRSKLLLVLGATSCFWSWAQQVAFRVQ
ncbi:MAG TPA: hypothetical protein ENK85_05930 [Saprospiraceae bacterium]|nr:hypothetical protein [Saprospiraceae bacterium]